MPLDAAFLEGVIYEVVAVTFSGKAHVAPIGVKRRSGLFEATIYHDTTTYSNLRLNPRLTLNVVRSGLLFYRSMREKESVRVSRQGDYWFVEEADLWLGVRVAWERLSQGRSVFGFEQAGVGGQSPRPQPYSRADGALVEMLVHASRIEPYLRQGMVEEARRLYSLIEHYYQLVARVAPNTEYQSCALAVYEEAGRKMGVS